MEITILDLLLVNLGLAGVLGVLLVIANYRIENRRKRENGEGKQ